MELRINTYKELVDSLTNFKFEKSKKSILNSTK